MYEEDANFIRKQARKGKKGKRGDYLTTLNYYKSAGERLSKIRFKLSPTGIQSSIRLRDWLWSHNLSVEGCRRYLKLYDYWWLLQTYKPVEMKDMTIMQAVKAIEELRWSKLGEREKPSWLEAKPNREPFYILYK